MSDMAKESVRTDVLIVGTGFGGLAAAIKLREAGFEDVLLIEKGPDVGGTWRDNTYPGCACDIPSHLYSLSFEPKTDWSRMYPRQPELLAYVREVADKHGLRARTRFNTVFLAADWDEVLLRWRVTTSAGVISCRVLISGMGGLHIPSLPKLPGLEDFQGEMFHSAVWNHSYDLTGKRVAVVGTGASAVQFVPQIAAQVAQLDVYQRTPAWVVPKPDRAITAREQGWFKKLPLYRKAFRRYLFLLHELRVMAFLGNKRALKLATGLAVGHLRKQVSAPALRAKLQPNYAVGCKRIMISNDYYPTFSRDNVALITDGIAQVRPHSVVDHNGVERPADAIIFGTGFEVTTAYKHTRIAGVGGQELGALWDSTGMEAFNGVTVSGFPNYFMLLGPHTALGHNSVVIMIEAQVTYIVDALKKLRAVGAPALQVDRAAQDRFIAGLNRKMAGTVWLDGGCDSWYKDSHGKVSTIWPGSAASYVKLMAHADLRDFHVLARADAVTA